MAIEGDNVRPSPPNVSWATFDDIRAHFRLRAQEMTRFVDIPTLAQFEALIDLGEDVLRAEEEWSGSIPVDGALLEEVAAKLDEVKARVDKLLEEQFREWAFDLRFGSPPTRLVFDGLVGRGKDAIGTSLQYHLRDRLNPSHQALRHAVEEMLVEIEARVSKEELAERRGPAPQRMPGASDGQGSREFAPGERAPQSAKTGAADPPGPKPGWPGTERQRIIWNIATEIGSDSDPHGEKRKLATEVQKRLKKQGLTYGISMIEKVLRLGRKGAKHP